MPPISLQTHLISSRPQLSPISVDPKGFKSALRSLIQFLIAKEIRATLWLKLPKDDAWWTDIWEYGQQAAGCTLYAIGDQTGSPPENLAASLRPLAIEQTGELKREYMCLALAGDFVCTLLAARKPAGEPTPDKRSLKLYCSTSGPAMTAMSVGLKRVIEDSLVIETPLDEEDLSDDDWEKNEPSQRSPVAVKMDDRAEAMARHAALSQWDKCFPSEVLNRESLPLTEAFLSWQMQQQQELRSKLSSARSASKNEATDTLSDDFLDKAGRELQSPLTTIKTALTLLGAPTLQIAQRQRYLEMISTQCAQQKALIDSIISLLRIQSTTSVTTESIQLEDVIPGVVSTYQPIAEEHGIMLAYTVPPDLAEVLGVESELKEVVIQLIKNGIEVTPRGGRVWVAATPQSADSVAITVQDSGSGISKTETAQLFDAFYRGSATASGGSGSGLGLTLVQRLLQRMGGSISVESVPTKGTVFKILLPINKAAVVAAPQATGHSPETAANSSPESSPEATADSNNPTPQPAAAHTGLVTASANTHE